MRSKEDETPKPIPRAPAHAGGWGVPSGWAKAPRVCLGEARNPLQWRGAVGRGRRRVARSTLQASARERTGANQARDWTGGWVSCLAEPHRASEGKRARSGFRIVLLKWSDPRLIVGNGGREWPPCPHPAPSLVPQFLGHP